MNLFGIEELDFDFMRCCYPFPNPLTWRTSRCLLLCVLDLIGEQKSEKISLTRLSISQRGLKMFSAFVQKAHLMTETLPGSVQLNTEK